jgi:MFS family permease
MMLLQYSIWAAWLPLFFPFLTEGRGFAPREVGTLFAIGATGGLISPFVIGQIADRHVNTERLLFVCHLVGAVLIWQLARLQAYWELLAFCLLYSVIYTPTLPLTNALALHHIPDRDRDFGKVRVWGTVGGIITAIGVGQWLLHHHTPATGTAAQIRAAQVMGMADAFRVSGILGALLALLCLTLPATPPRRGFKNFAPREALRAFGRQPLATLLGITFLANCTQQFYLFHTAGFLSHLDHPLTARINAIFGVGGGGLMSIGQMSEIAVLAAMPVLAKRIGRKALLGIGLVAYVLRFAAFAYFPTPLAVLPALALQGVCFGCMLLVSVMIVDEEAPTAVRASAQAILNIVSAGFAVIVGNYCAGRVAQAARGNYAVLFGTAMWICIGCFVLLLVFYPGRRGGFARANDL